MIKFNVEASVSLNFVTSDPVLNIIQAYRICRQSMKDSDSKFLEEKFVLGPKDEKLIKSEIEMEHTSPLEMVDFSFLIKCSRVTHLQLVRHRISSYSAQSTRAISTEEFLIPPYKNKEADIIYKDMYNICQKAYKQLLSIGESKENARYLLPQAMMSEIIYKTNLRSLRNAIGERTCKHAQKEIRFIFEQIKKIVNVVHPVLLYKVEKCYTCPNQCNGK